MSVPALRDLPQLPAYVKGNRVVLPLPDGTERTFADLWDARTYAIRQYQASVKLTGTSQADAAVAPSAEPTAEPSAPR